MTQIRTLIFDEPTTATAIRLLLDEEQDIHVAGEFNQLHNLPSILKITQPDLIIISDAICQNRMPEVFTDIHEAMTAHPIILVAAASKAHAYHAYEAGVLDYLLKPVNRERMQRALQKVRLQVDSRRLHEIGEQINKLLAISASPAHVKQLLVKSGGEMILIKSDELLWVEAAKNYVKLHTQNKSYLYRNTLNNLEKQLDPQTFVRIHRSYLVNMNFIQKLQNWSNGEYVVIMRNQTKLFLTRKYRDNLLGYFKLDSHQSSSSQPQSSAS